MNYTLNIRGGWLMPMNRLAVLLALCWSCLGCPHSARHDSDTCVVVTVARKPNPVIVELGYDDIKDRRGTVDYAGGSQHVLHIPSDERPPSTNVDLKTDSETVYFLFNRADIRESEKDRIDAFVAGIGVSNIDSVLVSGHTDSIGSYEHNIRLSEHRANAVKDHLSSMGVATDKITTVGYGEGVPVAGNDNEIGRQKNRRSEIEIEKGN